MGIDASGVLAREAAAFWFLLAMMPPECRGEPALKRAADALGQCPFHRCTYALAPVLADVAVQHETALVDPEFSGYVLGSGARRPEPHLDRN
ncbi:MAG: hypothetical protein KF892_03220 [Rhizobacter sp.]|nr:hypothetical protein [Rhizobacter sp.]